MATYEITRRGTDREAIELGGLRYWLDLTSDPHNSIGWIVEDADHVQDLCTVMEVAAASGARDYVVERTRRGIESAQRDAEEFGYPTEPVAELRRELAEVEASE